MIGLIARKIFGTQNDRELAFIQPWVIKTNSFEEKMKSLSNAELTAKTAEFKQRFANGEKLDSLLPESFAVCREASSRILGMRHYDVQLVGGATLHRGRIAEMKTGEGKTLVATLAVYLNAIAGKGVHVITVNDYLAKRDSEWMGRLYGFLGLSTGIIVHGLTDQQRQKNYGSDITYGTNNEFGFDYLRDNMKFRLQDYVQRELHFAIIDEVDSILIDEARTPLIISGPSDNSSELYHQINTKIQEGGFLILETDYTIDEKSKTASLTDAGVDKMESRLNISNLYDPKNIELLHHINQALRAHVIFKSEVDYIVRDGKVMIVDEFTGRIMEGRRWSDGLHQAIEAKEGVDIENENQTLASITFQNYFRMYKKLSGMTGTADTEAAEFKQIYNLDVTMIPTNKPMVRKDQLDLIYKTQTSKFNAIVESIKTLQEKGQPVLVGTVSVEKSELISNQLKKAGITHNVLNAKQHEREAEIVALAGRKKAITIATNMAGRGTDILLGGNPEVLARKEAGTPPSSTSAPEELIDYQKKFEEIFARYEEKCKAEREEIKTLGGLFILGTERHESRRIDNQLRGRAGRQGDPGESRFYLSLDDDLLRIFGGERIKRFFPEGEFIEAGLINKNIEGAQKKVEGHNYDIRKHLLKYDDVMNEQRKVVYALRKEVLSNKTNRDIILSFANEIIENIAFDFFPNGKLAKKEGKSGLDVHELNNAVQIMLHVSSEITENDIVPFNDRGLVKLLSSKVEAAYDAQEKEISAEIFSQIERMVLLSTIDQLWKDHLLAMDHLREGIGLRGYGQKDPLIEYKKEGFRFFEMMMTQITGDSVRKLLSVQVSEKTPLEDLEMPEFQEQEMNYNLASDGSLLSQGPGAHAPGAPESLLAGSGIQAQPSKKQGNGGSAPLGGVRTLALPVESNKDKVGRNDPCPCGSGKKYKKCHGS